MEQNTLIPNNDSKTSASKGFLLKNEENLAKTSKIRPNGITSAVGRTNPTMRVGYSESACFEM